MNFNEILKIPSNFEMRDQFQFICRNTIPPHITEKSKVSQNIDNVYASCVFKLLFYPTKKKKKVPTKYLHHVKQIYRYKKVHIIPLMLAFHNFS